MLRCRSDSCQKAFYRVSICLEKNGKFGNMREFSSYQGMLVDPLADLFSLIGWLTHYNGWVAVS